MKNLLSLAALALTAVSMSATAAPIFRVYMPGLNATYGSTTPSSPAPAPAPSPAPVEAPASAPQEYFLQPANGENFELPVDATAQRLSFNVSAQEGQVRYRFYRDGILIDNGGCTCWGGGGEYNDNNVLKAGQSYRFEVVTGTLTSLKLTYVR